MVVAVAVEAAAARRGAGVVVVVTVLLVTAGGGLKVSEPVAVAGIISRYSFRRERCALGCLGLGFSIKASSQVLQTRGVCGSPSWDSLGFVTLAALLV